MRGSSPPYSYAPRLVSPDTGSPNGHCERGARCGACVRARLGRGAHDGRSPPGVDEQGRADRRRRGLRGVRIPGVECQGSLPTRIPCASIVRGGAFGSGCTAPCGRRRRGIPYQASFGRGTPADVEDRYADHAPPSALRGRDRKFRRRIRRSVRKPRPRSPDAPRRDSTNSCRPGRKLGQ